MPRLHNFVPKYRLHRASRQAVVTLSGIDHYLGPWRSKVSLVEYDRLVSEWLAGGRQPATESNEQLTIVELIVAFWRFAKGYYRKNGQATGEIDNYRDAIRPFKAL